LVEAWELHRFNLHPALVPSVRQRTLLRNERRGILSMPCRASKVPANASVRQPRFGSKPVRAKPQAQAAASPSPRNAERSLGIQCATDKGPPINSPDPGRETSDRYASFQCAYEILSPHYVR
jgi:hypothetical protein